MQLDTFKNEAGENHFVMTPSKWIDLTGADIDARNQNIINAFMVNLKANNLVK